MGHQNPIAQPDTVCQIESRLIHKIKHYAYQGILQAAGIPSAHAAEWAHNLLSNAPPTFLGPHAAAPIGHNTHHNVRYGNHNNLNHKTSIVVNEAQDPGATVRAMRGTYADFAKSIRDLQGAAQ